MDTVAIIGLVLAFAALIGGNAMEGSSLAALFDLPALIIVLGGTLGAVVLQTPLRELKRAVEMVRWIVMPPQLNLQAQVKSLLDWSRISRREGMLGLEEILDKESDTFKARALSMVVDGAEPHQIRSTLETDVGRRAEADLAAAGVFHSMGGYAPTIGIIGAVLGLMQVMGNLTNPDQLGPGIATAFVATIYGVASANLLFLPIADRLRALVERRVDAQQLFIDGLLGIAEGDHPKAIESRLAGYLEY